MDNWQQDWGLMLETIARDVEQFVNEVARGVDDAVESLIDFSEAALEQMEEAIAPQLDVLDREMQGWFEPLVDLVVTLETSLMDTTAPITHTVDPIFNEHPACVGCRNYHGQTYNGVMFVCGMYPYGWEGEQCPDWESVWGDKHD